VVFSVGSGEYASAQSVQLKLGDYSLSAASSPKKEGGIVSLLQTSFVKAPKAARGFGFWYAENDNALSNVVLEIADAASKAVVKNVSAADLTGKAKTELSNNGTRVVSTYQFGTGASMVELQIESEVVSDETVPLGKKIHLNYKLRMQKASRLNAVLRLKTDGNAQKLQNVAVGASRMEKEQSTYPAIVVSSLAPVNIDVTPRAHGIQQVQIQAENISIKVKVWASLFSFDVVGTTVKDAEKTAAQVNRIVNHVATKELKPDLAIFNTANTKSTAPGDTVTYTITYCNIGTALAQDAEITNPVPDGVILLEQSVETKDADVVIERKPALAPEIGTPSLVRWKIKKNILPGEEGRLTMKVIVR
jgi:uncharacterized repeat protein (TIGR01451 family)